MVPHFKEGSYMLCNVPTSCKSGSLCHCKPYGQGFVLCWGKKITKGKASSTYVRKMLSLPGFFALRGWARHANLMWVLKIFGCEKTSMMLWLWRGTLATFGIDDF